MNNVKAKIVLAALLHDIGKFWQRGDTFLEASKHIERPDQDWRWLVPYNDQDRPGYQHTIWTYQFCKTYNAIFEEVLGQEAALGIANLAGKHHHPDSHEEALIQMADAWSSAIDRRQQVVDEEEEDTSKEGHLSWGRYAYKRIPLHSIFDDLKMDIDGEVSTGEDKHVLGIKPLSLLKRDIFPTKLDEAEFEIRKAGTLEEDYRQLWQQFLAEFQQLPVGSTQSFVTSLMHLLKKYTWCIPSSTVDNPNVSLFEHLKTTAAFAACLYDFFAEYPEAAINNSKRLSVKQGIDPVLMCCLDLSGIQRFIYDIASKKAFQSLKGRSFYLQLLLDQLLDRILNDKQIAQLEVNVIYSSGGKAYFLLPNTPDVKARLADLYEEIQSFLWEEHKGKIYAAFGYLSFRYEFDQGRGAIRSVEAPKVSQLGDLWREVSELAAAQKRQRFSHLLVRQFTDFFSEHSRMAVEAQSKDTCQVTGEPIVGQSATIGDGENNIKVLPAVEGQTNLGKALKDATWVLHQAKGVANIRNADKQGSATINFDAISRQAHVLDDLHTHEVAKFKTSHEARLTLLNDTNFLRLGRRSDASGYGFTFYGGNRQPIMPDSGSWRGSRLKTLEELCYKDDTDKEIHKMGVLRMDVDNLGQIFIKGFDEHNKSFAAYATLSFQLELFFSGYINTLREGLIGKDHLSILYAGGDDLFAVGRWDVILDFAQQVRQAFGQFTGRRDLSISAGVAIVDRKYPIYKAAEIAGEAEEKAKQYRSAIFGQKNAICFFDEVVSWDTEFDEVVRLKSEMVALIARKNGMSRGLLHQLQRYKANRDFIREVKKTEDFSHKWHSAYYLKRFSQRYEKAIDIRNFVLHIQMRLMHDTVFGADRFMELIVLAARWAEYELKFIKPSKHDDNGENEKGMGDR